MQHSNLPCHCLTLKKRSYHIIAAGLVSEFQTGNSSFTLQKWSCEVWSWIIKLSANSYIAVPSKTLFEMIRQVWLIKKRSRSHPSGCSVPEVRKSKVFQAVQLGNFPACQPLQLGYEVLAVLPRIPILLSNLSLKILGFAQGQAERSEAWPCAKPKIFRLKFFFPPRRRSPKQPSWSAKQKLKSFCLADQLGCFWAKEHPLAWREPTLIELACYELRFLQRGKLPQARFS